ncbi:hypothetical protein HPB50_025437 [Hyalomma asiaticum]|uniref:Uncharacterized protein n=1 Tax=Hyalomma asiaticum TaxID=266040 RepID=A0ACB7RP54_HYAAI|nr:hypothetical protein HPB50_025437 [Hyalomma asiaticum]
MADRINTVASLAILAALCLRQEYGSKLQLDITGLATNAVSGPLSGAASAINCYTCSSVNGTNPNCHDPFHPAHARYVVDCTVPKDGHVGRFPAHFCVKVVGRTMDTNIELVIRICSLETMDNSCGVFRYGDDVLRGCILTCNNDGCNAAPPSLRSHASAGLLLLFLLVALASSSKVPLTYPP